MSEKQAEMPEYMKAYQKELSEWKAQRERRMPMPKVPKITPEKVIMMPMRDGVELYTEVFFPEEGEGPFPTILMRTPYPDSTMPFSARPIELYCKAGYAFVAQSCRGTWKSDGKFRFFQNEPEDGYDCIEWLATQDWSDGKIGMYGSSYLGSTQWLAARLKPPHLTCIAPQSPAGMFFYETPYFGGTFVKGHILPWSHLVAKHEWDEMEFEWGDWEMKAGTPLGNAMRQSPNVDAIADWNKDHPDIAEAMVEPMLHPTLDDWWNNIMFTAETVRAVDIPVFAITGFHDGDQAGCLYNWDMAEKYEETAGARRHLLVGPWRHAQMGTGKTAPMGHVTFGENADISLPDAILDFFDAYLKGNKDSQKSLPSRCRLYTSGSNEWHEVSQYPPSESVPTKLFLTSDGNANSLFGDGALTFGEDVQSGSDTMIADWERPVPPVLIGEDGGDNETRHDVLVYTSEILEDDLTVLGAVEAKIFMTVDAPDADVVLRIEDVWPDGKAINMTGEFGLGAFRARYRHGFEREVLLAPDELAKLHFHVCHMGHTFKKGHRLRIAISATAGRAVEPNHHTGEPVATAVERRKATQVIYHDQDHPSHIILPVFGGAR